MLLFVMFMLLRMEARGGRLQTSRISRTPKLGGSRFTLELGAAAHRRRWKLLMNRYLVMLLFFNSGSRGMSVTDKSVAACHRYLSLCLSLNCYQIMCCPSGRKRRYIFGQWLPASYFHHHFSTMSLLLFHLHQFFCSDNAFIGVPEMRRLRFCQIGHLHCSLVIMSPSVVHLILSHVFSSNHSLILS